MSPASIAYEGPVTSALWAVDSVAVPSFVDIDRGSGTANLQVVASLAVRGARGMILRVNYIVVQSGADVLLRVQTHRRFSRAARRAGEDVPQWVGITNP